MPRSGLERYSLGSAQLHDVLCTVDVVLRARSVRRWNLNRRTLGGCETPSGDQTNQGRQLSLPLNQVRLYCVVLYSAEQTGNLAQD